SIKKLKELEGLKEEVERAEKVTVNLLEQYGGIMEEYFFLENILNYLEDHPENNNSILFLAEHVFSDNVTKVRKDREFNNLWRTGSADVDILKQAISQMVGIIESNNQPIQLKDLLERFKNSDFFSTNKEKFLSATGFLEATEEDIDRVLESYLRASRKIKQNMFNEWGLISWGTIQPRKINDKIYAVMKQAGKPLHFNEITSLINGAKFDEKVAYAPTVHNELILDDKYVLIGRGIYALKEWGYKPGNVIDVIEEVIRENNGLTKEEIIEKVLAKRNVKRSTVYLALMNSKKIEKRENNKYFIKEEV
ncbi:MAG: hypothetical protein AAB791_01115, partial [Patescibacteria group bacterium]